MISLKNISKTYKSKKGKIEALSNVNLVLGETGFVSISGKSGSGKTTLLNIISGIIPSTNGSLYIDNIDVTNNKSKKYNNLRARNISFVFQDNNLIENLSVKENIKLAANLDNLTLADQDILDLFIRINLGNILNRYPDELSGGQRQRVAIARGILLKTSIILVDEPTGALDEENSIEVFKLLKETSINSLVIVASHDKELVNKYATRKIEIDNGVISKDTSSNFVATKNITSLNSDKKNLGLFYSLKLGLKYIKFKSFKFYLSIFILAISFTLLLTSLAFMWFKPEAAYNSAIISENNNYGVITKQEFVDTTISEKNFSIKEAELIKSNFNNFNIVLYGDYVFFKDSSFTAKGISILSANDLNAYGFKIKGSLPKENEVLITKLEADYLNISDDYNEITLDYKGASYTVSGILDTNSDTTSKNSQFNTNNNPSNYLYFNKSVINNLKNDSNILFLLTDSSDYKNIQNVLSNYNESQDKYTLSFNNLVFDSVCRVTIFSTVILKIATPVALIFTSLSFLLLISIVYSAIIDRKKDIAIIKMLGGNSFNIFKIFIIQPIIIILISLIIAIIGYNFVALTINDFIKTEFYIYISLLSLTFLKIFILFISTLMLTIVSAALPIALQKKKY